jgi:hypothetical protein
MKYPIKYIVGVLFILYKIIAFIPVFIIAFIWNFNLKFYTELHEMFFSSFYVSYVFALEQYRYLTLSDFVYDRKCYIYAHSIFRKD